MPTICFIFQTDDPQGSNGLDPQLIVYIGDKYPSLRVRVVLSADGEEYTSNVNTFVAIGTKNIQLKVGLLCPSVIYTP